MTLCIKRARLCSGMWLHESQHWSSRLWTHTAKFLKPRHSQSITSLSYVSSWVCWTSLILSPLRCVTPVDMLCKAKDQTSPISAFYQRQYKIKLQWLTFYFRYHKTIHNMWHDQGEWVTCWAELCWQHSTWIFQNKSFVVQNAKIWTFFEVQKQCKT